MSRYIDADSLRKNINSFMNPDEEWKHLTQEELSFMGRCKSYVFSVIDFLQREQPEVDLMEEIDSFYRHEPCVGDLGYYDFRAIAEHFYKLGKEGQR